MLWQSMGTSRFYTLDISTFGIKMMMWGSVTTDQGNLAPTHKLTDQTNNLFLKHIPLSFFFFLFFVPMSIWNTKRSQWQKCSSSPRKGVTKPHRISRCTKERIFGQRKAQQLKLKELPIKRGKKSPLPIVVAQWNRAYGQDFFFLNSWILCLEAFHWDHYPNPMSMFAPNLVLKGVNDRIIYLI
jgi:hypothetical protein